MVREIPESDVPQRIRLLISCAAVGALALTLGACGRKGPLDPPPGGYVLEQSSTTTAVTGKGEVLPKRTGPAYDENGKPIAPEGPRRRTPADWLLD